MEDNAMIIKFIRLVQGLPVLYDPKHQHYTNTYLKSCLWSKIALELCGKDGCLIKYHWEELRNLHQDELRKQKDGIQRNALWLAEMDFLLPFMVNEEASSKSDNISEESNSKIINQEDNAVASNDEVGLFHDSAISNDNKPSNEFPGLEKKESANNFMSKEKGKDELEKTLTWHNQLETHVQQDPLHQFFTAMYNSTKNLPARHQLRIRKMLFLAVSQAEEEILLQK